jgi:hypothetical protein
VIIDQTVRYSLARFVISAQFVSGIGVQLAGAASPEMSLVLVAKEKT